MKEKVFAGFRKLEKAVTVINGALLIFITFVIVVQVIARKLSISLAGTEELARFSYVIYTFLAWPIACLYGTNISITLVLDKWPKKVRLWVLVFYQVLMACFSGIVARSAFLQMKNQRGVLAPSNDWFHMDWLYTVVFICMILCGIFNIFRAVFLITGDMDIKTQDERNEEVIEENRKKMMEMEGKV